jgi:long-chain fatty acid transport protein
MRQATWGRAVTLIALVVMPSAVQAGGFRIEAQGAAALGQGLAFSASAEHPTAVYYNPAGLTRLPGTQVALHGEWIGITSHFTNRNPTPPFITAGQTERDDNQPSFPVGFYATTALRADVAFGLGIFSPYGLALDWPPNGNTQFTITHVRLRTIDVNPVLAVRVSRVLSVAIGLDLIKATADLERAARLSATTASPFGLADADDLGRGVTVGLGGNPSDAWAWGVVYRSPPQTAGPGAPGCDRHPNAGDRR